MTFIQPPFWFTGYPRGPQHVGLSLLTAPMVEPLSVAEVKAHLHLGVTAGEPAPTAPTAALASPAIAGNVTAGAHRYLVTFVTADGETDAGSVSAATIVADAAVNGQVALTAIPLGGTAVTARKLYRTAAGGALYLLLATIANNTATTYTDNLADGSLGAQAPTTNTTADPEILSWIEAARMFCESTTDRALCTQTWRLTLPYWPGLPITLPHAPLQTTPTAPIVTYVDTAGVTQTLAATEYAVDAPAGPRAEPGRLVPVYAPTVSPVTAPGVLNAVVVQYVAGYGSASAVPSPIKAAMKLLIGHWYEHREAASVDPPVDVALGVMALLHPFAPVGVI